MDVDFQRSNGFGNLGASFVDSQIAKAKAAAAKAVAKAAAKTSTLTSEVVSTTGSYLPAIPGLPRWFLLAALGVAGLGLLYSLLKRR